MKHFAEYLNENTVPVIVNVTKKEGFVSNWTLTIGNLVLGTKSSLFGAKQDKLETEEAFKAFVLALQNAGFHVIGIEKLS